MATAWRAYLKEDERKRLAALERSASALDARRQAITAEMQKLKRLAHGRRIYRERRAASASEPEGGEG